MSSEYADCEVRDDWFLEQDVNAWTSVAYIAAAAVLAIGVARGRLPRVVGALAAVTALEGLGSFLYHGHPSDLGAFLHDASLVGMLGFVAGWHLGRLAGGVDRGALIGSAVGFAVGGVATNGWVAVGVVVIAVAELAARRRGAAPVWDGRLLALTAVAVLAWIAGSADGWLCEPDSWIQPHGLWHVLTAIAVVAWARRLR